MTKSSSPPFPTHPPPDASEQERSAWTEEQRLLLKNALAAIADGVFAARTDGSVTYMNPAAEIMFGLTKDMVRAGKIDIFQMMQGCGGDIGGHDLKEAVLSGRSILSRHMRITALSGKNVDIFASAQGVYMNQVLARVLCTCTDITTEVEQRRELGRQANTDPLTGCYNRRWFHNYLEDVMRRAATQEVSVGLLFMDLDKFKRFNDSAGFLKGDLLIQEVAKSMSSSLPSNCKLARIGGDEFIVIAEGIRLDDMMFIAGELHQALAVIEKVLPDGGIYRVSASLGVSVLSSKNPAFTQILTYAEDAKRRAKSNCKGRICTLP